MSDEDPQLDAATERAIDLSALAANENAIDVDIACRGCGYDLRSLQWNAVCPECGLQARSSFPFGESRITDWRFVRAMRGAFVIMILGILIPSIIRSACTLAVLIWPVSIECDWALERALLITASYSWDLSLVFAFMAPLRAAISSIRSTSAVVRRMGYVMLLFSVLGEAIQIVAACRYFAIKNTGVFTANFPLSAAMATSAFLGPTACVMLWILIWLFFRNTTAPWSRRFVLIALLMTLAWAVGQVLAKFADWTLWLTNPGGFWSLSPTWALNLSRLENWAWSWLAGVEFAVPYVVLIAIFICQRSLIRIERSGSRV